MDVELARENDDGRARFWRSDGQRDQDAPLGGGQHRHSGRRSADRLGEIVIIEETVGVRITDFNEED